MASTTASAAATALKTAESPTPQADEEAATTISSEQLQQLLIQLLSQQNIGNQSVEVNEGGEGKEEDDDERSGADEVGRLVIADDDDDEGNDEEEKQQKTTAPISSISHRPAGAQPHSTTAGPSSSFEVAISDSALPTTETGSPAISSVVLQPANDRQLHTKVDPLRPQPQQRRKLGHPRKREQQQQQKPIGRKQKKSPPTSSNRRSAIASSSSELETATGCSFPPSFGQQLAELFSAGLQHLLTLGASASNNGNIPNPLASVSVEDLGRMVMEQMCKEIGDQAQQILADLAELVPGASQEELLNGAAMAMAGQLGLLGQQSPTPPQLYNQFWQAIQLGLQVAATAAAANKDDSGIVADEFVHTTNGHNFGLSPVDQHSPSLPNSTANQQQENGEKSQQPTQQALSEQQQWQALAECLSMAMANGGGAQLEQAEQAMAALLQQQQQGMMAEGSGQQQLDGASKTPSIQINEQKVRNFTAHQQPQQHRALLTSSAAQSSTTTSSSSPEDEKATVHQSERRQRQELINQHHKRQHIQQHPVVLVQKEFAAEKPLHGQQRIPPQWDTNPTPMCQQQQLQLLQQQLPHHQQPQGEEEQLVAVQMLSQMLLQAANPAQQQQILSALALLTNSSMPDPQSANVPSSLFSALSDQQQQSLLQFVGTGSSPPLQQIKTEMSTGFECKEQQRAQSIPNENTNNNNGIGLGIDLVKGGGGGGIPAVGSMHMKREPPEQLDEFISAEAGNRRKKPREGRPRAGSLSQGTPVPIVTTVSGTGTLTAKSEKSLGALLRQHPEGAERVEELEELEEFANFFKKQRIKHGFTQGDVGVALGKRYGTDFSQTTISRFEALNLSFKNMCKLRPLLEDWLNETEKLLAAGATVQDVMEGAALQRVLAAHQAAQQQQSQNISEVANAMVNDQQHSAQNETAETATKMIPPFKKRRKRTNLDTAQKLSLDAYFRVDPRPDNSRMNEIAGALDLDQDVVRVWFCNRRQKLRKI